MVLQRKGNERYQAKQKVFFRVLSSSGALPTIQRSFKGYLLSKVFRMSALIMRKDVWVFINQLRKEQE